MYYIKWSNSLFGKTNQFLRSLASSSLHWADIKEARGFCSEQEARSYVCNQTYWTGLIQIVKINTLNFPYYESKDA